MFRISPYSVRMRENTDQKNTQYGPLHAVNSIHLVLTPNFPKNEHFLPPDTHA